MTRQESISQPIPMTEPQWHSLTDAASIVGVTRQTLGKYVQTGQLQAAKQPNGKWRVNQKAIEEFSAWYFGQGET
ncbi:DNA-binding protein [Bremerella cremea]|uniref:DNA-binding protein n=1 Tax=Bremerella cremea TaxID=1031537 RepID=A0A368KM81_9BACT|nr:helix-turn-helix domain-containing protein [Bremerella cremea]RCS42310.1 DNA-binding protein [Bremerella cremea]